MKIPEAYITSAQIAVEAVGQRSVSSEILAPASVAAAPGSEAVIVARATGTFQGQRKSLGDAVQAGEVLARVDSLEAATMASDRRVAQARAEQARRTFDREESLFRQGVTPRQDMEAAQAALDVAQAEARRAATVASAARLSDDGRSVAVVSPIAGRLTRVATRLGAYVGPDTELFRVVAGGAVQVEAAVTAAEAARLTSGDEATIVLASGATVPATVRAITPAVDGSSRAATVVLVPKAPAAGLLVGEGVQVRLHGRGAAGSGLAVPEDAVQNIEGRDVVFLRTPEGFQALPVLVGQRSGGLAQIISGVQAGQQVATRNAFLLKAESQKASGDD